MLQLSLKSPLNECTDLWVGAVRSKNGAASRSRSNSRSAAVAKVLIRKVPKPSDSDAVKLAAAVATRIKTALPEGTIVALWRSKQHVYIGTTWGHECSALLPPEEVLWALPELRRQLELLHARGIAYGPLTATALLWCPGRVRVDVTLAVGARVTGENSWSVAADWLRLCSVAWGMACSPAPPLGSWLDIAAARRQLLADNSPAQLAQLRPQLLDLLHLFLHAVQQQQHQQLQFQLSGEAAALTAVPSTASTTEIEVATPPGSPSPEESQQILSPATLSSWCPVSIQCGLSQFPLVVPWTKAVPSRKPPPARVVNEGSQEEPSIPPTAPRISKSYRRSEGLARRRRTPFFATRRRGPRFIALQSRRPENGEPSTQAVATSRNIAGATAAYEDQVTWEDDELPCKGGQHNATVFYEVDEGEPGSWLSGRIGSTAIVSECVPIDATGWHACGPVRQAATPAFQSPGDESPCVSLPDSAHHTTEGPPDDDRVISRGNLQVEQWLELAEAEVPRKCVGLLRRTIQRAGNLIVSFDNLATILATRQDTQQQAAALGVACQTPDYFTAANAVRGVEVERSVWRPVSSVLSSSPKGRSVSTTFVPLTSDCQSRDIIAGALAVLLMHLLDTEIRRKLRSRDRIPATFWAFLIKPTAAYAQMLFQSCNGLTSALQLAEAFSLVPAEAENSMVPKQRYFKKLCGVVVRHVKARLNGLKMSSSVTAIGTDDVTIVETWLLVRWLVWVKTTNLASWPSTSSSVDSSENLTESDTYQYEELLDILTRLMHLVES